MSGVQIQKTDKNSLELAAVSLHTLGRFHEALEWCVRCKLGPIPTQAGPSSSLLFPVSSPRRRFSCGFL
jgi:hypothetical protein